MTEHSHSGPQGRGGGVGGRRHECRVRLGSGHLGNLALARLVADVGEDLGRLVVVRLITLDERPAVDVDDHAARATAEEVKAAHSLAERLDNVPGILLLLLRELGDEARLLAVGVALDETVDNGRLARLGVTEVGTDGVDLDVLGWV